MCSASSSERLARKQEEEIVVSVVLVVVERAEITAGPHGTAAVGMKLKTLCAFPSGRYLHVVMTPRCQRLLQCMTSIRHVAKLVEGVASGSSTDS